MYARSWWRVTSGDGSLHRQLFFIGLLTLLLAPLGASAHAASQHSQAGATHAPLPAGQLIAGTNAIVRGEGDCLRLRAQPSLAGQRITCLPDGSTVLVLEGAVSADGFDWQRVQAGSLVGWAAAEFLSAAPSTPACTSQGARSSIRPGLSGAIPQRGFALVVWGGGTAQGIANSAAVDGCNLRSVWASKPGGGFVGYLYGAPDFVNAAWFQLFPGGRVPAGLPLVINCLTPSNGQPRAVDGPAVPPPLPSAAAPARTGLAAPPPVDAAAAVVIDAGSGAVLFEQDAHAPLAPASLTKIATAILAIEGSDLDGWLSNDIDSRAMPGSTLMGLLPGDCFPVLDVLYGLMLPSGNDAALSLGRHLAGSDQRFVAQLNTLLSRLGLQDSSFENPHGLDEDGHRSSAYDLAMLARYGMTLPAFVDVVQAPGWTAVGSRNVTMRNVNRFLTSYADADGVKTGFTEDAGRTLVASASKDGRRLFVVLLDAPNRFDDAALLLDWAFGQHVWPEGG